MQKDLEVRLSEALPWVLVRHADLDWGWLVQRVTMRGAQNPEQNRLGFLVGVARAFAARFLEARAAFETLTAVEQQLERVRLAREDTLCRDSMPAAERSWLKERRSPLARHWNLLTGLTAEELRYDP